MKGQEIAIDTGTLLTDINALQDALANARKQLQDMFDQVAELDTMWDGPANDEFRRQFDNDHENAEELCKTVDSIIKCMQYAREQYDLCENDVNTLIAAINI